jgi:hypothetical protein
MDDNLDNIKKDILNEAQDILKRGIKMNNNDTVELFTGDLGDETPVTIYMDNPTKEDMPFITVAIGMFSFGIPMFVLADLSRALNIADSKMAQFYQDNAANIKEHEHNHDEEDNDESEEG